MSKMKSGLWAILPAVGAVLCLTTPVWAQEPPPGAAPPGDAHAHWAQRLAEREEDHAKRLRAILDLRPDQEPALQAFLAGVKPPMDHGRDGGMREDRRDLGALTTPQRLDAMAAMMTRRQAEFQRRADAVRTFYAALTPAQQRAFDALHPLRGEGHGRWGGERRGPDFGGPDKGR